MSWRSRATRDHERDEEMRAHLEMYVDELVARGRTPDEARRMAQLAFGNLRARREEIDEMNRLPVVETLWRDLSYAVRVLRRTPAFSLTAILTLALVIGANAAVFSLANTLLLRPLPYPDPDRLFVVETRTSSPRGQFQQLSQDGPAWEAVRDHARTLDAAVLGPGFGSGVNLVVGDVAAFAQQQRVSAGYFHVLGVAPFMGREFTREEDVPNGPPVTVISHAFWQRFFAGDPQIIGKTIQLKGEPFTVVGVMPAGFTSLSDADVWTPLRPGSTGEGAGTNYELIARLHPGATVEEAAAELRAFDPATIFRLRGFRDDVRAGLTLVSLKATEVEGLAQPIVMLLASVGTVLLIACVNLATLLIARGATRGKEIGTRMALGSGRAAVIRQLMVEAAVLALVGGLLGLAVGAIGLEGLKALGHGTFSEWSHVTLDGRVLAVTMGLAGLTSLLFGLVPAIQASRIDVHQALASGGTRSVAGGSHHWPRRLLVVAEVALGVVLLVSAALLIRTFASLSALDPGFRPDHLVTAGVSLQDARYTTSDAINHLFDRSLDALSRAPGVEAAAVSLGLPYQRLLNLGTRFTDAPPGEGGLTTNASYVTPGFFGTFGIAVIRGRAFTADDRKDTLPVAIVNQAFADIYSPHQDPVGRRIRLSGADRTIVGVVANVKQAGSGFYVAGMIEGPITSPPSMYLPAAQVPDGLFRTAHTWFPPIWTVRARTVSEGAAAIRAAVATVDPLLPVADAESMTSVMGEAMSEQRLMMTLVGVLAAAALVLAAIGLHGLVAHGVAERRREFGIRMALGATSGRTMRQVALDGLLLSVAGIAAGGLLSVPAVRLVRTFLWGVSETDPSTYVAVAVFLLVVAGAASVLPALRILRLDPATTLRE